MTPTKSRRRVWIERLNILLRFAYVNPWKLTNGKRQDLLDDLHFAMFEDKRNRADTKNMFEQASTPEGIKAANDALKEHLECGKPEHDLELGKTWLHITIDPATREYRYTLTSFDFTTLVFIAYADILFMGAIKPDEILKCAHCGTRFIPKRKPKKGTKSYCSKKCRNVIAARAHRASMRSAKKTKGSRLKKS